MEEDKTTELLSSPVRTLIWKMTIPSLLGLLSYNLYHMINTVYVARGIGVKAAGGLSVTFPLLILLSAVSNTLGAGAASVISRAIGGQDMDKASRTAANTFLVFWSLAAALSILGLIFMDQILTVMGVTDQLRPYAVPYTRIILAGAVTATGFSSLIRAEGSSRYAMFQWIIPIIANMVFDPVLIFGLHLGVQGAAMATVLSQCISTGMCIYYFFMGKSVLNLKPAHFKPDPSIIREIILIGLPSFIQLAGQSLTIFVMNNLLKNLGGGLWIGTYGVISRVSVFLMIPLQGLVQGIQPVIGYNWGAGNHKRVVEAQRYGSRAAACYGLFCTGITLLFSEYLLCLFFTNEKMILLGSSILKRICLGSAFTGMQMIQAAALQAVGHTKAAMILSLSSSVLCLIPLLFLFSRLGGLKLIWLSFPLSALLAFGITTVYMIYWNRHTDFISPESRKI